MSNSFLDTELSQLMKDCRRSVEGTPEPRITIDIQPSIMLGIKKMYADVQLPQYMHEGDNCFDIRARGDLKYGKSGSVTISTGLAFDIPAGYCLKVYSRSGQGFNHDVRLANGTGIIDSGFKGELMVKLTADSDAGHHYLDNIQHGDRIAQAMLIPVPHVTLVEVYTLSDSSRGVNGLGSSGSK